ncbi:energy-coupling factor transporter ATPase [Alloscardovia omnicolens]|uniref:energy-coupling factor transporter ATPase n=1 Tax=Alloscardovia omnicolens TaxID=419015 RepID=UPI003A70DD98
MLSHSPDAFRLHHVSFSYQSSSPDAVADVTLTIPRGQWVTLIGSNGSGKSTLARMLAAVSAPSSGSLDVLGTQLYDEETGVNRHAYVHARRRVAYVPQNPEDYIVGDTVKDDVAFEPENLGWQPDDTAQAVYEALEDTGMVSVAEQNPLHLSGGQQQRVAMSSALSSHPDILILDEPFAYVDSSARECLLHTLRTAHQRGVTIVVISHHQSLASYGDRVLEMKNGRIVRDEPSAQYKDHDALQPCTADNIRRLGIPVSTTADVSPASPLLTVDSVSYSYESSSPVLSDFSMTVNRGEFVTISGPNGSGKSTLLSLLAGTHKPTAGTIDFSGQRVGITLQKVDKQLFASSVFDDIAFGPRSQGLSEHDVEQRVHGIAHLLGITSALNSSVWNLSGGQQRLVACAGVVAMNPDVLIVDEPTAGLDAQTSQKMLSLLETLHARGMTIIMVTHELQYIKRLATRAIVLEPPQPSQKDVNSLATVSAPHSTFDPRALTVSTLALLFTFFAVHSPAQLGLAVTATSAYVIMSHIRVRKFIRDIAPFTVFICCMGLFNLFFDHSGETVLDTGFIQITTGGLWTGLLYAGRFTLLASVAVSYLHILPPNRISDAVERMCAPLTRWGMPIHQLSLMSMLSVRFLPLLRRDFHDVMVAQELRGAQIKHGSLRNRLESLQALIVPAFAHALRHADNVSVALDVRGYDPDNHRVPWRVMTITWRDYVLMTVCALYIITVCSMSLVL